MNSSPPARRTPRILFICHDGGLYGSQQSLALMLRHLPSAGYQCFVSIARPGPLQTMAASLPGVTVLSHRRLQWVKHDPRSFLRKLGDVLTLLVAALPRALTLARVIRREKIDVVHTNVTVSLEGALAARLAGVPHIWHIRELWMEKSPKFHFILGRRLSRWLIDRLSDRVICISEAVRRQFGLCLKKHPERYELVHNAIDLHPLPNPPPQAGEGISMTEATAHLLTDPEAPSSTPPQAGEEKSMTEATAHLLADPEAPVPVDGEGPGRGATKCFTIGYIGRLSEGKGLHILLEALVRLAQRGLPVALAVAGGFVDKSYENRIRQMITENDLAACVRFLGYKEDVTPLYEAVDALVVPSLHEPFGRVVIEAMMHGAPCVAANAGGIPELIVHGETGLLYPPEDPDALADRLESLISSETLAAALRRNARQSVYERFNIETQIGKLNACYQSVISRQL